MPLNSPLIIQEARPEIVNTQFSDTIAMLPQLYVPRTVANTLIIYHSN